MKSDATVSPIHYHIRWLSSGKLDWESYDTRIEAEEAAERLCRRGEQYRVERFEENCVTCASAAKGS